MGEYEPWCSHSGAVKKQEPERSRLELWGQGTGLSTFRVVVWALPLSLLPEKDGTPQYGPPAPEEDHPVQSPRPDAHNPLHTYPFSAHTPQAHDPQCHLLHHCPIPHAHVHQWCPRVRVVAHTTHHRPSRSAIPCHLTPHPTYRRPSGLPTHMQIPQMTPGTPPHPWNMNTNTQLLIPHIFTPEAPSASRRPHTRSYVSNFLSQDSGEYIETVPSLDRP